MLITELIDVLEALQKILGDIAEVRIQDPRDDRFSHKLVEWTARPESVVLK